LLCGTSTSSTPATSKTAHTKQIHSAREVLLPILLTLFVFTESLNIIIGSWVVFTNMETVSVT